MTNPSLPRRSPLKLHRRNWLLGAALPLTLAASPLFAGIDTWNGGGTDNNWSTIANWGGVTPVNGDSLVFAGVTRLTPNDNFANGSMFVGVTFNAGAGAFTLTGNRISLGGNVTNNSTNLQSINLDMTVNFSSPALAGGAGGLSLGGTVDMNGNDTTLTNTSQSLTGLITDNSSTVGTTTLNITGSNATTFAGSIADGIFGRSVAIFNTGASTAALTGFNAYSGGTIIDSGTIQINSSTGLGSTAGVTTINHGTLEVLGGNGEIDENLRNYQLGAANSTIQVDAGTSYVLSGTVSDWTSSGSLNVAGGGTLTLAGTNTYTGSTNVNTGTLILVGDIPSTTAVSLSNGGTIVFSDPSTSNNFGSGTTITVNTGGGNLQYGSTAATSGLTSSNKVVITAGATLAIQDNDSGTTKVTYVNNAVFSGAGNLIIENIGNWPQDTYQMGGNNSALTGNITVLAPAGVGIRLQPTSGSVNSLGTGIVTIANGSEIFFSSGGITYSNTFNIAGIGTIVDNPALGVIRMANGQTLSGTINLTGNATITVGTSATNTGTLTGRITGIGALTMASGTFTLNNATANADTYGPGTVGLSATIVGIVNSRAGTVIVGNTKSLSTGGVQMQGGTLDLNGLNIIIANLSSTSANGTISGGNAGVSPFTTPPATTAILNFGTDGSSASYGGTLIDGNGKLALNKTGAGTTTLTAVNTYTGSTTISGGELDIAPGSSLASTSTTVASGATLSIASGASIPSATNLLANGTVKFNQPGAGIATLNGTGGAIVLNTTNLVVTSGGSFSGSINANGTIGQLSVNAFLTTDGVQVSSLNLNANQQIRLNGTATGTSKVNALNLAGSTGNWTTGLDIANNKLIVEDAVTKSTTLARLQDQVNFGTTHSAGVFSSTGLAPNMAIAVIDNAVTLFGTFGGLPADSNSILVGPELLGDANVDGHVDLSDLSTILNNFGATTPNWTDGNFDGAATIDLTDLSAVLNNFGLTNLNPSANGAASAVIATPEPATLLAIVSAAPLLLIRRRRNTLI